MSEPLTPQDNQEKDPEFSGRGASTGNGTS
jgi:hypothetical protein